MQRWRCKGEKQDDGRLQDEERPSDHPLPLCRSTYFMHVRMLHYTQYTKRLACRLHTTPIPVLYTSYIIFLRVFFPSSTSPLPLIILFSRYPHSVYIYVYCVYLYYNILYAYYNIVYVRTHMRRTCISDKKIKKFK